jgi:hypothetical protein
MLLEEFFENVHKNEFQLFRFNESRLGVSSIADYCHRGLIAGAMLSFALTGETGFPKARDPVMLLRGPATPYGESAGVELG